MNFDALTRYLDSLSSKGVPGCDLAVWVNHEPVYRHFTGESQSGVPMQGNETYWFYSASKVITMTAAMQLIERGLMKLDDPVSKYLPAYENLTVRDGETVRPAKTVLTIEHLMSMQGGLDYNLSTEPIRECLKETDGHATTRQLVDSFAKHPLSFDPGTRYQYSLCHDVVAAIVEVVSGKPFGEYLQENIFVPLGMNDITFHPNHDQFARLAARYVWDVEENPVEHSRYDNAYALSDRYESGGAGLMGSLESYIPLADALANDGVGRTGARILTRESIDEMRKDRLSGASADDFFLLAKRGYSYGLGVRTLTDAASSRSPLGEFGWDGAAGAWVMMDPINHIAAVYTQHILGCGRSYAEFHPTMRDLIYEALEA